MNAHALVYGIKFTQAHTTEGLPQHVLFFAPLLEPAECRPGIIFQFRPFFGLFMELHVNTRQFLNRALIERRLVAPQAPGYNEFAKLCAVIAQMVEAFHPVAAIFKQVRDGFA